MQGRVRSGARPAARLRVVVVLTAVLMTLAFALLGGKASADPSSPLSVTKSASASSVPSGTNLTYTIVVKNTAGSSIGNVVLTDQVNGIGVIQSPPALPQLVITTTQGSCTQGGPNGNLVTCNAGTMAGGASFTVTIGGKVTAGSGTTLNNTASVSGTKTSQSFTSLSNTTSVSVTGSTSGNLPDLTINKTGPTSVATGTAMTYTLTVNNIGTANATGVKVVDTVPAGITGITTTASSLFQCALSGQTVTCTGGQVNFGQNATITIAGTSPSTSGTITNTAVVDPDNTIVESNELNNTSATVNTTVGNAQIGPLIDIKKSDGNPKPAGSWWNGAGPDPAWPGAKLTYKILVTNNATGSNATATNVVTTDPTQGLDASTIVASQTIVNGTLAKTDGCTVTAGAVKCTIKSLNSLGTQAITITGTVVQSAGSTIFNTATVTGNVKNQGVTNTATEATTVRPAIDLTITKADGPDPVCASSWPVDGAAVPATGNQHLAASAANQSPIATGAIPPLLDNAACFGGLTYTLVVGNSGIAAGGANGVEVRDPLPPGVIFDTYRDVNGAGFVCSLQAGNAVDCTGGHVGPGQSVELDLLTAAPSTVGTISNTAYVDPNNAIFEADETNNTATETTTVSTGVDLTVFKGDKGPNPGPAQDPPGSAGPLNEGFDPIATNGTDTYTIVVANVGTQDATGIKLVDTLPAGTKFLSVSANQGFTCAHDGSATGGNVTCISGHLRGTESEFYRPAGVSLAPSTEEWATIKIKIFATPFVQPAMHNVVRVDPDNTIPEANENNNVATDDTQVTVGGWSDNKGAFNELKITKTQGSPSGATPANEVAQNGTHFYNLHVENDGSDPVSNVVVKDFLPVGSRFISAADTNNTSAARFFCTHDGSPTGGVVTCTGGDFSGLVNTIPDGSGTVPTSRDIKIVIFAPNTPGTYTNHATVDPDNVVPEGNEFDNDSSVDTKVTVGGNDMFNELTIKKEQTDPANNEVATSSIVTYKLTVSNTGSDPAFNVKVTDTLPSGFTFISAVDTTGSPSDPNAFVCATGSGNTVNCTSAALDGTVNHLAPATFPTRFITVKAYASSTPAVYTNTAVVDPQNTIPEGNETNNTAQVQTTVKVGQPQGFIDLTVDKTGPATVVPGQQITYDVNVHNLGTDPAFNVKVRDDLPAHTSFISVVDKTGGAGAFSCGLVGTSILCTGGTLDGTSDLISGVPADRQIEIVVQSPTSISQFVTDQEHIKLDITNTAVIDPDNTIAESNETNNTSNTVTTTVTPAIDLTIKKQGPGSATQNQPTSYTITVTNNAVGAGVVAKGIEVVDPFPTGLIPLNASTSGDFACQLLENPVNSYDCIGDLKPGDTATIKLDFFVTLDSGTLDNEACVDPSNTIAESNEINNCSDAITGVAPQAPDLQITKTADKSSVTAGEDLKYTLNVSNIGTADTTNGDTITVTDNVPSDVTVQQVTPDSGWQCTNDGNVNHVKCTHLGFAAGDSSSIVIATKVGPNPANPFTNTATVGGDPADTQSSNNTASVKTNVGPAAAIDLQVTSLQDNPDPVNRSDKLTYTAIVQNNGTSPANNAVVRVKLPNPGSSNQAVNASNGFNCVVDSGDSSNDTWNCTGDFDASGGANASTTITASVTVDPGAPDQLEATVIADPDNAIAESDETNNTKAEQTSVTGTECSSSCVDLVASAFGDPVVFSPPGVINDTVTVANIGTAPVPDSPAWTIKLVYTGAGIPIFGPPPGVTCIPSGPFETDCTSQAGMTDAMDLAAGAGLTFTVIVTGEVPGAGILFVTADSSGAVTEFSEGNNVGTWTTVVLPPPGP
jgi:uncharacterized repeat protein (TIGR01451 family)